MDKSHPEAFRLLGHAAAIGHVCLFQLAPTIGPPSNQKRSDLKAELHGGPSGGLRCDPLRNAAFLCGLSSYELRGIFATYPSRHPALHVFDERLAAEPLCICTAHTPVKACIGRFPDGLAEGIA